MQTIAATDTQSTFGVFFGDNTFPSATFPTFAASEAYLIEMGVVGQIMVRTDETRPGIVAPVRVTYGTWQRASA